MPEPLFFTLNKVENGGLELHLVKILVRSEDLG